MSVLLDALWEQYRRVLKPGGAVLLFAQMPFGADLINSNRKWYRYEWIWHKTMPVGFDEVMTTAEAAERWGISAITVKQACSGQKGLPPRFKEGEEFRKSGRTWLVTKAGMERLYGKEKE